MSGKDEIVLPDLAGAILDDATVDWDVADSSAAPDDRPIVRRLKTIAAIARAYRADMPDIWGPLHLLEPIGRGAYGDVYRAWDSRLDREVALKLLPADRGLSNELATSIIEEGRLLARVRHPNVVTVYGAERIGDQVGLWMEYIDGRTLHQLVVDDRRHFPPREVAAIGQALCGAVAAVHAAGLLHRDIKAQNVMMGRDGRVALMDFGAGRDRSATSDADLTGTPLYLAPEVLTGAGSPSAQSDIYGTGVLLFFLLTGTYPVTGTDIASVRSAHERGERRSLKDLAPSAPRWLARAVERAIDPDPARRYASAEGLSADLGRAPTRWKPIAAGMAAAALVLAVSVATGRWNPAVQPTNLQNYEDYLRARALLVREGVNGPRQAVKLFERILASDPKYAPAHAGLVLAYAYMSMNPYQGLPFEKAHPLMRAAALEAISLDPTLAEAHVARGWVHARDYEWAEAERAFRRAIALNRELTISYTSFSYAMLQPLGRAAEAEQLLREAERIDPLAEHVRFELGRVLVLANRPADAIAILTPLRLTDSGLLPVDLYLGRALLHNGQIEDALPLLERRRERLIEPAGGPHPWVAWAYVKLGRRADAEKLAQVNDRLPMRRAVINGALGNTDRMFSGFEEMFEREPQRVGHLMREPEFAPFRQDERFTRLLRRMNQTQ